MTSLFDDLAAEIRSASPDRHALDDARLKVEMALGMTSAERDELRGRLARDLRAVDAAVKLRDVPTHELLSLAEAGDRAACAELDRRRVEPPMVPLGPDPVITAASA